MLRNSMSRLIICILLILGAPSVNAGQGDHRDRTLRVMTRNMDLGSDFGYIFEALATNPNNQSALLLAITKTYLEVLASQIPQRADALAAEIQTTQPDLVALQEVSTLSTGPLGGPATTVIRGRGKLSAEVGACVLAHVLGEFVLQKVALLVDNSQADGFRALRLIELVPVGQDLGH